MMSSFLPKTVWVKIELYDSQMNFIADYSEEIIEKDLNHLEMDTTKDVQRSVKLTLNNITGEFIFNAGANIWIDKRIKLWLGLTISSTGQIEWIQLGLFALTAPINYHDEKDLKCEITASDKAFYLTNNRGKLTAQTTITQGTPLTTAIQTLAGNFGETMFNFDPGITFTIPSDTTYDIGTNVWKALNDLATLGQCQIWYDRLGYLRLKAINLNDLASYSTVWSFDSTTTTDYFFIGAKRTFDESNLYNQYYTSGGSDSLSTGIVYDILTIDDTVAPWIGSPYAVQKLGYLTKINQNDVTCLTQSDCHNKNKWFCQQYLGFSEDIELYCPPIYILEAGDVVSINDPLSGCSGNYYVYGYTLPLVPKEKETLKLKKLNLIDMDWNSF